MAADAGVQITPEIAAGLEAGGAEAVAARQSLVALMQGETAEMAQAGAEYGDALTQGTTENIENGSGEVVDTASGVGKDAGGAMRKAQRQG